MTVVLVLSGLERSGGVRDCRAGTGPAACDSSNGVWPDWQSWVMDAERVAVIALIANIVLVFVTAAYVVSTKRMADASEMAAKAAQESADAAKSAAQSNEASSLLALAALPVDFSLSPRWAATVDEEIGFAGVQLECTGSTVFVHHGTITRLWRFVHPLNRASESAPCSYPATIAEHAWAPPAEDGPRLLHAGDAVDLDMAEALSEFKHPHLAGVEMSVAYSYSANGEVRQRSVRWLDER